MTNEQGNPSSWRVVSQTQQGGMTATGQYATGWLVKYRTGAGIDGDVFVPTAQYNPETVRALIQAEVDQLVAVSGLSG